MTFRILRSRWALLLLTFCFRLCQPSAQENGHAIPQLIDDLQSGNTQERRNAARTLSELGTEAAEALSALIPALDDGDEQVWFHAVTAIARIGPQALPAVPALLEDLAESGRKGANPKWYRSAFALGSIGPVALPKLRPALKNSDFRIRSGAAKALGWLGEKAASVIPDLVKLLNDENENVRLHAAETLGKIGPPAIPALRKCLQGTNRQLQLSALSAVQTMESKARSLSEILISIASADLAPELQIQALRALRRIQPEPKFYAPVLWPLALHASAEIRREAAEGVLALPAELSVPRLAKMLNNADASASVQLWAADILGRIGPAAAAAAPELVRRMEQNNSPETAETFKTALASMGTAASDALFQHIGKIGSGRISPDHWAVHSLVRAGIPGLAKLADALQHENDAVRLAALYGIQKLGADGRTALPKVERVLRDPNDRIRAASLQCIVAVSRKPDRYQNDIHRFLEDDSAEVRQAAAISVPALSSVSEPIISALEKLLGDRSDKVRLAALRAFKRLGGRASAHADSIATLLVEQNEDAQIAAVEALGAVGQASLPAVAQIAHLAAQASDRLRLAALRSLAKLADATPQTADVYRASLAHPNHKIREASLVGFGKTASETSQVLSLSVAALEDESDEVKLAAAANLGRLGEKAVPATQPLMNLLTSRSDHFTRFLEALKQIPAHSSQIETYLEGLGHSNPAVRAYACEQLGRLKEKAKPAIPKLQLLARRDQYSAVKRRAKKALENIVGANRDN